MKCKILYSSLLKSRSQSWFRRENDLFRIVHNLRVDNYSKCFVRHRHRWDVYLSFAKGKTSINHISRVLTRNSEHFNFLGVASFISYKLAALIKAKRVFIS